MRRKKGLFQMIMRLLPRRIRWILHSITRKRFNTGMVVNGASVVVYGIDKEPDEYRIGGYYSVPCMHNNELMRCEKIFFLNDMINIVFDAFTMIGYQSFAMETTDAEHMFRIMDKEAFLKQPENTIFKTGDYDYYNVIDPFFIKGGSTGKSGGFYFGIIHTELHITDFAPPGRRSRLPSASALPFAVGSPQKASEYFSFEKGTFFMVFDTEYFIRLIMRERAWQASQKRGSNDIMPFFGA